MTLKNDVFPSDYERFVYTSRYARWLDEEKRRENWDETVTRYLDYLVEHLKRSYSYVLPTELYRELWGAIYNFEVMPSMRALMSAGPALDRDNTAGYNCSYLPVDSIEAFDEAMYILMCGTGVGFSVENKYVSQLPEVPEYLIPRAQIIKVGDSKEGWATALRELITILYEGYIPTWDTSAVRKAGARLKTFGGRASGPKPLVDLFKFVTKTFLQARGRKLTSLEAHDIMCKIGEVVVVGGVRRSAMISLSDLTDKDMATAKSGEWWKKNVQRALANNSVAYESKPDAQTFLKEWTDLIASNSGERGIFNREASKKQAARNGRRKTDYAFGTNPCSEIILRPYSFCNLTESVIRSSDDIYDLRRKVRLASILGTFQSTLANFPYLRDVWRQNAEEERLLGVSLTGIMDNEITNGSSPKYGKNIETILSDLRDVVVQTNDEFAKQLGINASTATTCVKPSGTVSQLVDSSSGMHDRHSAYYIRTVRADNKDPLTQFMKDSGIPSEPDITKPDTTTVFSFPMKAPANAIVRNQRSAIEQLELWLMYQRHWCEHKPSVTISVKPDEWIDVGQWVYNHFDEVSGVSFLPYDGGSYKQAPYQECDEERYNSVKADMPKSIDWAALSLYEKGVDTTTSSQQLACVGAVCEIIDIGNS